MLPLPVPLAHSGRLLALLLTLLLVACGSPNQPSSISPTVPTSVPATPAAQPASSPSPAASPVVQSSSPVPSPSPSPSAAAAAAPARRLAVVATTTQIQDFVRNVGGERVEALGILPPDADAHDYQPTAEDARKLGRADVVFANGVGLEPWLDSLHKNARSGVPVVVLADAARLPIRTGEGHEHDPGAAGDPHVWFDPTNVQRIVEVIRETLAAAEPPGASAYGANATAYRRQLDALDAQVKQQIDSIPPAQRKLVTNHDAFGYYADRYGLEIVGSIIPSFSTEAEPSAAETRELIAQIKAQNVKAIFTERSGNPRFEQQIAQQAGVKVVSTLYSDALGPPGSDGDTYVKMMQFNTREIVQGLK